MATDYELSYEEQMTGILKNEITRGAFSMDAEFPKLGETLVNRGLLQTYSMRLFGLPFQMLDSVDRRFSNINSDIGNSYLKNFVLNIPIVSFRPGMPLYTGASGGTMREMVQSLLVGDIGLDEDQSEGNAFLTTLLSSTIFSAGKKLERRMFGFRSAYWRYISSVNLCLRTAAVFLGIESMPVFGQPSLENGSAGHSKFCLATYAQRDKEQELKPMDWGKYRFRSGLISETYRTPGEIVSNPSLWDEIRNREEAEFNEYAINNEKIPKFSSLNRGNSEVGDNSRNYSDNFSGSYDYINDTAQMVNDLSADQSLLDSLGIMGKKMKGAFGELFDSVSNLRNSAEELVTQASTVQFVVEPSSFSESFRNETAQSMIEQTIDMATNAIGSEIAWITNSSSDVGVIGNAVNFLGSTIGEASAQIAQLSEPLTGGFLSNVISGGLRTLKGEKMIYPDIYKSSNVQTNYTFTIHLNSPYGDKYNYYMNILVPLFHLICLAAPRMVSANTTTSPFLVQAYIPGMCSVNLGIIDSLEITKNPDGKHVSVEGYPLSVDVTVSVRELYNALSISTADDPASFLNNESLIDYITVCAGLDTSTATDIQKKQAMFIPIRDFFKPENMATSLVTEPLLTSMIQWFQK